MARAMRAAAAVRAAVEARPRVLGALAALATATMVVLLAWFVYSSF